jgi:formamidopyrimidine-DNA glycosylase
VWLRRLEHRSRDSFLSSCAFFLCADAARVPELAEVEYYRRVWNPGLGAKITRVHLHPEKRVFRGTDPSLFAALKNQKLLGSDAAGKQMLFRFSGDLWLGVHLGMTGKLSIAGASHLPGKHDHLVLFQKDRALVFTDARQFGRVLIQRGKDLPSWWSQIGPAVTSDRFTKERMRDFLERHGRLPIKGALLLQKGFPGIGNWMADEMLWRAGISPNRRAEDLRDPQLTKLWKETRFVARVALEKIGPAFGDPPKGWLFHERWSPKGVCPKHKTNLRRETVATRTTAWCPKCQK